MNSLPQIVITAGEPAGIGPDIVLEALGSAMDAAISVVGDPDVLGERAGKLGLVVDIVPVPADGPVERHRPGRVNVRPVPVARPVVPGRLDRENAAAVLRTIELATDLCLQGHADAMVTAPVHKGIINDAGIPFQGHTEWVAHRTGCAQPVMMLASPDLRVCLATTHLPLSAVPAAISRDLLLRVLEIMDRDIGGLYGIPHPVIGVLGLNPHAGEGGHMGREEIDTIEPVIKALRQRGLRLEGPLPADTAFTADKLPRLDAILAMYHDQGLPVVKHQDFGKVVNITLGLPIVRTSVDHGTALDLAGSGRASATSLASAIELAVAFARRRRSQD